MALNDIACPRCGKRCHLMAGINVLPAFPESMFVVCWNCEIVRSQKRDGGWKTLKEAKQIMPRA